MSTPKSHWNYRAIQRTKTYNNGQKETFIEIVEAYYTNGKLDGWTKHAMWPIGETREQLRETMEMMNRALEKPLIIARQVGANEELVEERENWN